MVGEFPELQGLMGRYYAQHDGEPSELRGARRAVLAALRGRRMPETRTGMALALADKLDTLAGIFDRPETERHARSVRPAPRSAGRAAHAAGAAARSRPAAVDRARGRRAAGGKEAGSRRGRWTYIVERLRSSYLEGEAGRAVTTEMFDAVLASRTVSPLDFDVRLRALERFLKLPEAESLAAANKRIANILRKAPGDLPARSIRAGCRTEPSVSCSSMCSRWSAP